jgi:hypothetical protein
MQAQMPGPGSPVGRPGGAEDVGDLQRGGRPGASAAGRDLPGLAQAEPVEGAGHGAHRAGGDLGAEGGVVELGLAERDLDHPDIGAILQEVGGEAVAQGVVRSPERARQDVRLRAHPDHSGQQGEISEADVKSPVTGHGCLRGIRTRRA